MTTTLSLHQNKFEPSHLDYIRNEKPTVDLILNPSDGQAQLAKDTSPNTSVITRIMEWNDDAHIHNMYLQGNPEQAGEAWAQTVLARRGRMGKYAVLINEPPCDPDSLAKQARAEIAFMKALDRSGTGIKAGIGTFSGGNLQHPSIDGGAEIRAYAPALAYAKANGHALFIHLYFVRPAMGGATPSGKVHNPYDLAFRWRQSLFPYMRANGIAIPDTYVTEYGLDLGFAKSLYDYVPTNQGVGYKVDPPWGYGTSEQGMREYANDLVTVANEIGKDSEIKGFCIFCAGDNGDERWRSFMVDRYLLSHLQTIALPQPTTTTPPTPPPPPTGGNVTLTDKFVQLAQAEFGALFEDLRSALPKHATLKFSPIDSRLMRYACFHHSATPINTTWKRVAEAHIAADPERDKEEWAGIGYHIGIRQGKVSLLGDLDTKRAHVYRRNHEALGICWMGNSDTVTVPASDINLMKRLVKVLDQLYERDKELTWHGAMLPNYTACPGGDMRQIVPTLRATTPQAPDWRSIVFWGEESVRKAEAEGKTLEAQWMNNNWVKPAIVERKKVYGK